MSDQLSAARAAVDTADAVVGHAARHLAEASAEDGKISVARLDQHQTLAYDLAHAAAAVEGSKVMCTYGEHGEVESMLARAYVADAIGDVATRMLGRTATWGVDVTELAPALPFVEALNPLRERLNPGRSPRCRPLRWRSLRCSRRFRPDGRPCPEPGPRPTNPPR